MPLRNAVDLELFTVLYLKRGVLLVNEPETETVVGRVVAGVVVVVCPGPGVEQGCCNSQLD